MGLFDFAHAHPFAFVLCVFFASWGVTFAGPFVYVRGDDNRQRKEKRDGTATVVERGK